MSRVAKKPVVLPAGVQVSVEGQRLKVQGAKGKLEYDVHPEVEIKLDSNVLSFAPKGPESRADALAGTTRAVVSGIVMAPTRGSLRCAFNVSAEPLGSCGLTTSAIRALSPAHSSSAWVFKASTKTAAATGSAHPFTINP